MAALRITNLQISGLKAIDHVDMPLTGMSVLIGDNGSGKSCIIEGLELIRQAGKATNYVSDIVDARHGGIETILRRGARRVELGVTIAGAGEEVRYDFQLGEVAGTTQVLRERVRERDGSVLFERSGTVGRVVRMDDEGDSVTREGVPFQPHSLSIPWLRLEHPAFFHLHDALQGIELHPPFDVRPAWEQVDYGGKEGARQPSILEPSTQLPRHGLNLPNAYQTLRNRGGEAWERLLTRARLGLGDDVRDFSLAPLGRGRVGLEVVFGRWPDAPVRVEALSNGQVAYLCFIALVELNAGRSLLVFDEPESHLHPGLMARVTWMLEEVAETAPVVVATHSDRLLDALADAAASTRLCRLDENRATALVQPDADALKDWLESYRGLGAIRSEGYEAEVFPVREREAAS